MNEDLANTGTALQAVGYTAAPFTEGASLTLVGVGEGFDAASGASSFVHDLSQGKGGSAAVTLGTTVIFGAAGKKVNKLEQLTKVEKKIVSAEITTLSKVTDKAVEKIKSDGTTENKTTTNTGSLPTLPTSNTMQQDVVKNKPEPKIKK